VRRAAEEALVRRSINKDLKKKMHALRKRQKESFGTGGSNAD